MEDLTAVVFLEAFRRRRDVVILERKLLPWLYGIATNVLRNRRRALWRHRSLVAQLANQPAAEVAPDVPACAEAAVQMRSVLKRIARLPRRQQESSPSVSGQGSATRKQRQPSGCRSGPSARASPEPAQPWRNSTAPQDIQGSRSS